MKMDGVTVQTRYTIKRHPEHGTHPVWYVFDKDRLVCACAYLKGAEALIEELIERDRK